MRRRKDDRHAPNGRPCQPAREGSRPTVTDVVAAPAATLGEDELLRLVASLEASSEHPLADAIVRHAKDRQLSLSVSESFESFTGRGAAGVVDGSSVAVGNDALMASYAIDVAALQPAAERLASEGKTPMYVAADGTLAGLLAVADPIKAWSKEAIAVLRGMGLEVVMLTGDNRRTAEAIAREAGIGRVVAGVLPEGKVAEIRRLQSENKVVAMIGDGVKIGSL